MSKESTENSPYYARRLSGYSSEISGHKVEPIIYQPKPLGARILAEHYKKKYDVNINIVDHTENKDIGDRLNKRFEEFSKTFDSSSLEEGKPVGFLLMHGLNHVVPVVFSREEGKNHMLIFDATSGCSMKSYYPVANMFPDFQVLLNNGTRQADVGSCVTDGIVILKDALRMKDLGQHIINEKLIEHEEPTTERAPRFFGTPLNQENFRLFRMPEELLKTSQTTKFVEEARPDYEKIITKNNETLGHRRGRDKTMVAFNKQPQKELGINGYLRNKSEKHVDVIMARVKASEQQTQEPSSSGKGR